MTYNTENFDDEKPLRRRSTDGGWQIKWQLIAWVFGVLAAVLTTYNATQNSANARTAVLESQMYEMHQQMNRLNDKLDQLLYLSTRGK